MVNLHINNSYLVRERRIMQRRLLDSQSEVLKYRSLRSLICEWRTHNLLYDLHLFRSRTKDVDLNYPQKWYCPIVYAILSFFYIP